MKRFYEKTGIEAVEGGFRVLLDGRSVKTPARSELVLPVEDLAVAVASEWDAQGEEIAPDAMPLTRLATTATDRMPELRDAAIQEVADYTGTDLVCYPAASPDDLVRRQHDAWQPALDWIGKRYGLAFAVTVSLVPVSQSEKTLNAVRDIVAAIDDWPLVGVHGATTGLGSVVLALALWHGEIEADAATDASLVDALFEIERWGEERDASRRHEALRRDIRAVALFLSCFPPSRPNGQATNS